MDKTSEAYRAECEARLYLSTPAYLRQHYIGRVAHFRGDAAAQRLLEDADLLRRNNGSDHA